MDTSHFFIYVNLRTKIHRPAPVEILSPSLRNLLPARCGYKQPNSTLHGHLKVNFSSPNHF